MTCCAARLYFSRALSPPPSTVPFPRFAGAEPWARRPESLPVMADSLAKKSGLMESRPQNSAACSEEGHRIVGDTYFSAAAAGVGPNALTGQQSCQRVPE